MMRSLILLALIVSGCTAAGQDVADDNPPTNATQAAQAAQPITPVRAGEDIVAVYRMNRADGAKYATMTVEAGASGAARIEMTLSGATEPSQVGWATKAGDVIMTVDTPEGSRLIRAGDMATVMQEVATNGVGRGASGHCRWFPAGGSGNRDGERPDGPALRHAGRSG